MAIGSTIPVIVIQKIVPRIISKLGDLDQLGSLLLSKCNNLPLHIKCNDPRITDIKKLLARIQKLVKSLGLLITSLNKIIKTLNAVASAGTIIKLIQLSIPLPPGAPPGPIAEVLGIVNKLLQNIKSAMPCFLAILGMIELAVSLCNMAMANALMLLGSVCNSESFSITSDVKTLIDSRSRRSNSKSTSTGNTGDSLVTDSDSLFYYEPVASDDDINEYVELLNTIANDLQDPTKASDYVEEAPTLVYSGNGSPDLTVGKLGDYYVDLVQSKVYGPKTTDESWV